MKNAFYVSAEGVFCLKTSISGTEKVEDVCKGGLPLTATKAARGKQNVKSAIFNAVDFTCIDL